MAKSSKKKHKKQKDEDSEDSEEEIQTISSKSKKSSKKSKNKHEEPKPKKKKHKKEVDRSEEISIQNEQTVGDEDEVKREEEVNDHTVFNYGLFDPLFDAQIDKVDQSEGHEYTEIKPKDKKLRKKENVYLVKNFLSCNSDDFGETNFRLVSGTTSSKYKILVKNFIKTRAEELFNGLKLISDTVMVPGENEETESLIENEIEVVHESPQNHNVRIEMVEYDDGDTGVEIYSLSQEVIDQYKRRLDLLMNQCTSQARKIVKIIPFDKNCFPKKYRKQFMKLCESNDPEAKLTKKGMKVNLTPDDFKALESSLEALKSEIKEATRSLKADVAQVVKEILPGQEAVDHFKENYDGGKVNFDKVCCTVKEDNSLLLYGKKEDTDTFFDELQSFYDDKIDPMKRILFSYVDDEVMGEIEQLMNEARETNPFFYCNFDQESSKLDFYDFSIPEEDEGEEETEYEIIRDKFIKLRKKYNQNKTKSETYDVKTRDVSSLVSSNKMKIIEKIKTDFKVNAKIEPTNDPLKFKIELQGVSKQFDPALEEIKTFFETYNKKILEYHLDQNPELEYSLFFQNFKATDTTIVKDVTVESKPSKWICTFDDFRVYTIEDQNTETQLEAQLADLKQNGDEKDLRTDNKEYMKYVLDLAASGAHMYIQQAEGKTVNKDIQFKAKLIPAKEGDDEVSIAVEGNEGAVQYLFTRTNTYTVMATKKYFNTFKNSFEKKMDSATKILDTLSPQIKTLDPVERKALETKLMREFGVYFEEQKQEGKGDEDTLIAIRGCQTDKAYSLLNKHPLLTVEFNPDALYPPYWTHYKETREGTLPNHLVDLKTDDDEYKKVEKIITDTAETEIMNGVTNFKILQIQRFQHHNKWFKFICELSRVRQDTEDKGLTVELEKYLFNIFRFQGHKQILEDNDDITFETKKHSHEANDTMNNTQVQWLGTQTNYFTDNLTFTHNIGTEKDQADQNAHYVFLAKTVIGNTATSPPKSDLKVPILDGQTHYDCLNIDIADPADANKLRKVYAFYTNEKTYPEYLIKYSVNAT